MPTQKRRPARRRLRTSKNLEYILFHGEAETAITRPVTELRNGRRIPARSVEKRCKQLVRRFPRIFLNGSWENWLELAERFYPNDSDAFEAVERALSLVEQAAKEEMADPPVGRTREQFIDWLAKRLVKVCWCPKKREQVSCALAARRLDLAPPLIPAPESAVESIARRRRSHVRLTGRHGPPEEGPQTCNEAPGKRLEARKKSNLLTAHCSKACGLIVWRANRRLA